MPKRNSGRKADSSGMLVDFYVKRVINLAQKIIVLVSRAISS
ncbi:hypothetical protein [Methanosarcina horonobensis]|nr:hypothetical protein [Methanosarcina horonobensis]